MKTNDVPIVAIVGRANVGKSSLFNRMVGYNQAIVAREAGTTRDSVVGKVSYQNHDFWLVDTAGIKDPEDDFELTIQEQISEAMGNCDLIVVAVQADTIITDEDRQLAKMALKSKTPVILSVNKIDQLNKKETMKFEKLGVKPIIETSATQNRGIDRLLDEIVSRFPAKKIKEDDQTLVMSLLGRPNVGKSNLFNTLSKKQQAIVSNVAGTTRDLNSSTIRYHNQAVRLLDTAGIRRSGKISKGVEQFSVIRSLRAIEMSDVCLLLMDVNEPSVQLDQKIAGMIKDSGKGLILVVSKWDSVDKDSWTHDNLASKIQADYQFAAWAPLIFTSSVTGQNVTKLLDLAFEIKERRSQIIKTTDLNRWLGRVIDSHPPSGQKNRHPKLNYIVQQTDESTPTFKIFGGNVDVLHWSYKRHLERELRKNFDYSGTPVRFNFVEKRVLNKSKK